jgi:pyruvate,water dikinase
MVRQTDAIVWLKDVDRDDSHLVGEKAANLGELIQNKFPVPLGFVITSTAYAQFLRENKLEKPISHLLNSINYSDPNSIKQVSFHIKRLISSANFLPEISKQIFKYYEKLDPKSSHPRVAIRTSIIGIHSAMPSSIVPHDSLLNIEGESVLAHAIREVWASVYDADAIHYRHTQGKPHDIKTAIIIQKMINADISGLLFTSHPISGDKKTIVIEAVYGLGEYLKHPGVKPDQYLVNKSDNTITLKKIYSQHTMLVKGTVQNKEVSIHKKHTDQQKLPDTTIQIIAELAKRIENHYFFPQDAEWSIENKELYITETQPLRTSQNKDVLNEKPAPQKLQPTIKSLLVGEPASPGVGVGKIKILSKVSDCDTVRPGDVIVVQDTNKKFESAMRRSSAIIAEKGTRSSHTAFTARQFGIPAVVGVSQAKSILKNDMVVTVKGNTGEILQGNIKIASTYSPLESSEKKLKTNIYLSLTELKNNRIHTLPYDSMILPIDIVLSHYGIHPKKALHDKKDSELTTFFVKEIGVIAKSSYPQNLICFLSEMSIGQFRSLIGGKEYEPSTENDSLIGYRGSYRHINDPRLIQMELGILKSVRSFGYNNLHIGIPFTRTYKEFELMKKYIHNAGFRRSTTCKIWYKCSTPSNVYQLTQIIDSGIDGIVIDAAILSQLVTGFSRENEHIAHALVELDSGVLELYKQIIVIGKKNKIPVIFDAKSISLSPDLIKKVLQWGVTNLSTTAEQLHQVRQQIYEEENIKYANH